MSKPFRLSLRISLIGILVSVFVAFLIGMLVLFAIKSPIGVRHTANRVIKEVSLGVNTKAESLFKPVDRQLQFTKSLVTDGYFSQHAMTDDFWVDYSFRVLRNLPSVKMVYFYLPNGHFIISRYKYDDDSEISTELVTSPTGPDNSVTYVRDWHGVVHKTKLKTTSFDARSRPWFKAAMASKKAVWSAPYVFQTGRELGITRSMPVVMKTGTLVMGVDFTLQSLSTFVTKLSKLRHRIVMLLNRDGDVLAYPGMENIITWPSNNKIPIQMIVNAWVQGAFRQYKQSPEQLIEGSEDGIGYVANFSSIPGFDHKDWLVGTVATVSSLVGSQRERLIESMFWVLGMMFVCIFILWFVANRFSKRIMSVEAEMKRLSVMDFSHAEQPESHIKEIGTIESALQTMRNGLTA